MTQDSKDADVYRVTITFNQVENMPGSKVVDTYELRVDPRGRIDLDWLNNEIENLFLQAEPDPSTGIRDQRDPFVLTQTRGHVSWGAESAAVQFLVETAANIGKDGAEALIGAGILKLVVCPSTS